MEQDIEREMVEIVKEVEAEAVNLSSEVEWVIDSIPWLVYIYKINQIQWNTLLKQRIQFTFILMLPFITYCTTIIFICPTTGTTTDFNIMRIIFISSSNWSSWCITQYFGNWASLINHYTYNNSQWFVPRLFLSINPLWWISAIILVREKVDGLLNDSITDV